jgi:hypothetical protein
MSKVDFLRILGLLLTEKCIEQEGAGTLQLFHDLGQDVGVENVDRHGLSPFVKDGLFLVAAQEDTLGTQRDTHAVQRVSRAQNQSVFVEFTAEVDDGLHITCGSIGFFGQDGIGDLRAIGACRCTQFEFAVCGDTAKDCAFSQIGPGSNRDYPFDAGVFSRQQIIRAVFTPDL